MDDARKEATPISSERLEVIAWLLRKKGISVPESQTIRPRKETGACPLSFAQERLWFLSRMDAGNLAYNLSAGIRLKGRLLVPALEQTFNEIIRRHEALRTVFIEVDGQPMQVAQPPERLSLTPVDVSHLPQAARAEEGKRLALEEARRPFDLSRGPLVRVHLWRFDEEDHLLLVLMHHIVSDGWSMGVLVREVGMLYESFSTGQASRLRALPIQYGDFACWQREWLQGPALAKQLSYWKQQLLGAPPLIKLPTDRPRPPVQSSRGARLNFALPASLSQALDNLIRREGVTLFVALLAAFKTLLYHYTKQDDILVGSPIANRNKSELEGLIGFFVNSLVMRTRLSGELSFREVLRRVRDVALAAFAHQDLPFEKLVEELQIERDVKYAPLFQIWFVLQNSPMPELELAGLTFSSVEFEKGAVRHDLRLDLSATSTGLRGSFDYRTDLFDALTIASMARHFQVLLQRVTETPDASLNELSDLLDEADKRQMIEQQGEFKRLSQQKLMSLKQRAASGRAGRGVISDGISEMEKPSIPGVFKRKAVKVSPATLIKTTPLHPRQLLPLVVEAAVEEFDACNWGASNREFIGQHLSKHGGLLLRGFKVRTPLEFERFVGAVGGDLLDYSYRSTPRTRVKGNVFTSTEYPPNQFIPLHNEMSYSRHWPMKIFFFCMNPADQGGETPIADSRRVFEQIDPKIKARFIEKKVMYVRNYGDGLDLRWQQVFQTESKVEVEAFCRQAGIEYEWHAGDRLRTRQRCQAVAAHPRTGEMVWFNQAHLFHVSNLESSIATSFLEEFREEELPRNAYHADGSPLETSMLDEIRSVYSAEAISFPWREGDILLLDNMLAAHGRTPFAGSRKVLVGMCEPFLNENI